MPDSGSPSAADCWWLECPGEVLVHTWPAFTPIPWHLLLAFAREGIGRTDLSAGAGRLRLPSRGISWVTPKELAAARIALFRWGSDVGPKQEWWGPPARCAYLPMPHLLKHPGSRVMAAPSLPARDYLLKRFDTG